MTAKYNQITLKDTLSDCQDMFQEDSPSFFRLLNDTVDISEFIPADFYHAFHLTLGRKRIYPLEGFLSSLIFQKVFSIFTDSLLIPFLVLCRELRDFCGFSKVPDAPLFSRFKTTFLPYIELMFQKMVDLTEPFCQLIDSSLANILTFDTSGIELYVTENNPKTLNSPIKRLKAYYKDNPDVDPYKMASGLIPSQAASGPDAKQQYINRYFCYADKFAILTNGLGLIRHIAFLDDVFKEAHPEMPVGKNQIHPMKISLSGIPLHSIPSRPVRLFCTPSSVLSGYLPRRHCLWHHVATKADVFPAGMANQFTLVVSHRLSYPQYIRSLKPLVT